MKRLSLQFIFLFVAVCATTLSTTAAQAADEPAVRAILFYSPNCPHCHQVINEVLLPMLDEYGKQLEVVGIDTSQEAGSQLYQAALERYQAPKERQGVPTLVIHDLVLVGSQEIPDQLPDLVKEGLAAGGIDWPDIPGLAQLLTEVQSEPSLTPASPTAATPTSTLAAISQATIIPDPVNSEPKTTSTPTPSPIATSAPAILAVGEGEIPLDQAPEPPPDPVGMALAAAVLASMMIALGYTGWRIARPQARQHTLQLSGTVRVHTWAIPGRCVMGLGIASYLADGEVNQVKAICGPVGQCNVVQSSEYALLLGVPIAVWGVLNYLALATLWAGQRFLSGRMANLSLLGMLGLTLFGILFSIYLTGLELFAIHAVCAWCLGSAVITTVLMLLVVIPATDQKESSQLAATHA